MHSALESRDMDILWKHWSRAVEAGIVKACGYEQQDIRAHTGRGKVRFVERQAPTVNARTPQPRIEEQEVQQVDLQATRLIRLARRVQAVIGQLKTARFPQADQWPQKTKDTWGKIMDEYHVLDEIGTRIPDFIVGGMSVQHLVVELARVRKEVISKRDAEFAIWLR